MSNAKMNTLENDLPRQPSKTRYLNDGTLLSFMLASSFLEASILQKFSCFTVFKLTMPSFFLCWTRRHGLHTNNVGHVQNVCAMLVILFKVCWHCCGNTRTWRPCFRSSVYAKAIEKNKFLCVIDAIHQQPGYIPRAHCCLNCAIILFFLYSTTAVVLAVLQQQRMNFAAWRLYFTFARVVLSN